VVTPGQRHESTQLEGVLDAVRVPRTADGRPRKRPERLIADRGYSFPSYRGLLRRRGIPHVIPERKNQRERRRGRPPKFDREAYRRRNAAERCVNRLKQQWRGAATRHEKRAVYYRAAAVIASLIIFWVAS
jgi:transposase